MHHDRFAGLHDMHKPSMNLIQEVCRTGTPGVCKCSTVSTEQKKKHRNILTFDREHETQI